MTVKHRLALCVTALLLFGLLGCLRAFGPDLRPRGAHAGLPVNSPNDTCMSCHESEADALARMRGQGREQAPWSAPMMDASGPPLVADWMIEAPQPCTHCHRIAAHE